MIIFYGTVIHDIEKFSLATHLCPVFLDPNDFMSITTIFESHFFLFFEDASSAVLFRNDYIARDTTGTGNCGDNRCIHIWCIILVRRLARIIIWKEKIVCQSSQSILGIRWNSVNIYVREPLFS